VLVLLNRHGVDWDGHVHPRAVPEIDANPVSITREERELGGGQSWFGA